MYKIFEELLEEKGLTAYRVAKDTGLNPAMFTGWKNGSYTPKADKLKKIADYFNVPVDYFFTGETSVKTESENPALEEKAIELFNLYEKASPEVQKAVEILLKSAQ